MVLLHAYIAKLNEKSYVKFLFFQLWLIAFKIYGDTPGVPPTKNEVVLKSPNLQMRIDLTINF